ncbi:MAG: hypothetical protein CL883_05560 [Dehalococcoidia bacterium]|nr:hypothetical protein [Dehalococcoidia bacterium]
MAKRKYFLVIDTETTQTDMIADFGAVLCDKQGRVHKEIGILLADFYTDREAHPLFHMGDFLGGAANLPSRYAEYDAMLQDGRRMLASVAAVNRWLARVNAEYQPVATAYNKAFDWGKMRNSGIDCDMFSESFCLWHAAAQKWGRSRKFLQFVLDNHYFGNRTQSGHMGFQTKADVMAKFLLGPEYPDEPHTALEDARDYEVPILANLVKRTPPKQYMNAEPYNWRNFAMRDWFKPK